MNSLRSNNISLKIKDLHGRGGEKLASENLSLWTQFLYSKTHFRKKDSDLGWGGYMVSLNSYVTYYDSYRNSVIVNKQKVVNNNSLGMGLPFKKSRILSFAHNLCAFLKEYRKIQ